MSNSSIHRGFLVATTLISTLVLLLSACSSGGGDSTPTFTGSVSAGIYDGTVTPTGGTADSAVALITSTGKVTLVDIDTLEAFIGTVTVVL